MLYLCATPIGNLGDMTERCVEILKNVDVIAAEDTRNSIRLLNHFDIHTPMTAYHEYNRYDKAEALVEKLREGASVACITDAGTPGISDPGEVLVKKCIEAGIPVTSVPGACAAVSALILSGLSTRRFRFEGFLPTEKKERKEALSDLQNETCTLIFYEAPHRLKRTLSDLCEAFGDRRVSVVRELTKKHEEVLRMTLREAVLYYEKEEPRGEFVLVLEGRSREARQEEERAAWERMSVLEHVQYYEAQGLSRKDAMKAAAKDRNVTRREIYSELLPEKD
ncbi:MAG: 16S rRNA (cytidine(1402)-2'-O)-methyltransferase [Lachnospiraceae bacterium]|nr:16S rRNA (cytidine(1402)-2'-O)-methyltransferase [Lachnospiraceae bacterium]